MPEVWVGCVFDKAVALSGARRLVDLGVPPARAAEIAASAACSAAAGPTGFPSYEAWYDEIGRDAGLPYDPPSLGEAPALAPVQTTADPPMVKAVRDAISPWLWILSIAGFGMAVMNTRRVSLLWKRWGRRERR